MLWFGISWGAPVCDPMQHAQTPVGQFCNGWCDEIIVFGDQGVILAAYDGEKATVVNHHLACYLRIALGSWGHHMGLCTCHLSADDPRHVEDPPGLTKREAAEEAMKAFYSLHPEHIDGF